MGLNTPVGGGAVEPGEGPRHHYLSTGCFHMLHDSCLLVCKYCSAWCMCPCHGEKVRARRAARGE